MRVGDFCLTPTPTHNWYRDRPLSFFFGISEYLRDQVIQPERCSQMLVFHPDEHWRHGHGANVSAFAPSTCPWEGDFFIDNLLVRIHYILEMIWWTGLAPWEFECPFPGSITFAFPRAQVLGADAEALALEVERLQQRLEVVPMDRFHAQSFRWTVSTLYGPVR